MRHLAFRALRAALPLLALAAAVPAAASAGTYDVESCRASDGGSLATRAWVVQRLGASFAATDGCPQGDAMRGVLSGARKLDKDEGAQFVFKAPGNTTLTNLVFDRELDIAPGVAYQLYALVGAQQRAVPIERCFGAGCAAVATRPVSGTLPNGTRAVVARLSCRPENGRTCKPTNRSFGQVRVTRTVVTVEDIRSPVFVRPPEGPLTSPAPGQVGLQKLKLQTSDAGGGLKSLTYVVDGAELATFPFTARADSGCGTVFADRASCPNSSLRSFFFDTAKIANGAHELVLRIRDAAGNATDSDPLLITTNNPGAPGVFTRLTAGLGSSTEGTRLQTRKLRYGSPATLAGFVTDAANVPLPNVPIRVTPRIGGPGGTLQAPIDTTTDGTGRYRIPVPVGPSRSFEVRSLAGDTVSAVSRADLQVAVPITLNSRRVNGRTVRLSGSIPADPRPAEGVFVEIQAKKGSSFTPFRVLRTTPRGDFALTYRFGGRGTFTLRAIVKQQGGLPFAMGTSKSTRFLVR